MNQNNKNNNMENNFISTKDKLPEFNTRVLIVVDHSWAGLGKFTGDGWYEYRADGLLKVSKDVPVTHWQYFPALPNDHRLLYDTTGDVSISTLN